MSDAKAYLVSSGVLHAYEASLKKLASSPEVADGDVTKPFVAKELMARIRTQLRRSAQPEEACTGQSMNFKSRRFDRGVLACTCVCGHERARQVMCGHWAVARRDVLRRFF